ncbi:hypothetical protein, partial [Sulfitobacter sp.]|uniref:hypothetical protein n=1 Tax=Sulfitobacter sp. TaxID=1903071 RepID=UPI003002AE48
MQLSGDFVSPALAFGQDDPHPVQARLQTAVFLALQMRDTGCCDTGLCQLVCSRRDAPGIQKRQFDAIGQFFAEDLEVFDIEFNRPLIITDVLKWSCFLGQFCGLAKM